MNKKLNIEFYINKIKNNNLTEEEKYILLKYLKENIHLIIQYDDTLHNFLIDNGFYNDVFISPISNNTIIFKNKDALKQIPHVTIAEYEDLIIKHYEGITLPEEEKKLEKILRKDKFFLREYHIYSKVYIKPDNTEKFNNKELLYKNYNKKGKILTLLLSFAASVLLFLYLLFSDLSYNKTYLAQTIHNKEKTALLPISQKINKPHNLPMCFKNNTKKAIQNEISIINHASDTTNFYFVNKNFELLDNKAISQDTTLIHFQNANITFINKEYFPLDSNKTNIKGIACNEIKFTDFLIEKVKLFFKNKANINIEIIDVKSESRNKKGILINDFGFIASKGN
ncbi:MAG: hypothetical protein N3A01_08110 [Bacteroidales bacterium]|nr:hypothetical protein [Bacteroidales bacterium]